MLKFCVVPLYFMHHACTLREEFSSFIPLPVTADTGSPTQIMRSCAHFHSGDPFRLLLQGQFTHLPLPSHTCRWLSGCFRSATLPFHRISFYEITYKFIRDQVSSQPFVHLKNRFHTQTIIQLLNSAENPGESALQKEQHNTADI